MKPTSKFLMATYPGREWSLPFDGDIADIHWLDGDAPDDIAERLAAYNAGPTLADLKTTLSTDVDNAISAIYSRFQRFTNEYEAREAAARGFKAADYTGTPDPWVMSFATPAGLTATQATDLIISQADALRGALAVLGAFRMRKYEIAAAADAETAQAIHDDILTKAQAVAAGLQ